MPTYLLSSGEAVEYEPNAAGAAFLAHAKALAADHAATPAELLALVYGTENPLLDTASVPGRAIVTRAVFENPLFHVLSDLAFRKQLAAGGHTLEQVAAAYTLSVKDVAGQLGLSETAVRSAILARKLSAWKRSGDWYVRPESVASYKVSNRGRKKKAEAEAETPAPVRVRIGSAAGGSMAVKLAGGELVVESKTGGTVVGHFPTAWARAAVRTTTSGEGGSVRVFELVPASVSAEVEHLGLSVHGPFEVVAKHNSIKAANAAWKRFAVPAEAK